MIVTFSYDNGSHHGPAQEDLDESRLVRSLPEVCVKLALRNVPQKLTFMF